MRAVVTVIKGQNICIEIGYDVYRREEDWVCVMSCFVESIPEMRRIYVLPCQRVWQSLYHSTDNFLLIAFLPMYKPLFFFHTLGGFAHLAL